MMVAHFARERTRSPCTLHLFNIFHKITLHHDDDDGVGGVNSLSERSTLYSEVFYSKIEMKNHL